MNKRLVLFFLLSIFSFNVFSAEKNVSLSDEELDYAEFVNTIKGVSSPYLKDNKIIFTANNDARSVGIAFDFENYKTIHYFKIKKQYDLNNEEINSFFFYVLDLPKTIQKVKYRLVIDGLWTLDPLNEKYSYDEKTDLILSDFDATRYIPPVTEIKSNGKTKFIYTGFPGQKIRLGGSFTNWDSWIYEMKETSPGLYEFELPLPPGKYEYAYFSGITSFTDNTNPKKCYSKDGKIASLLIVE